MDTEITIKVNLKRNNESVVDFIGNVLTLKKENKNNDKQVGHRNR